MALSSENIKNSLALLTLEQLESKRQPFRFWAILRIKVLQMHRDVGRKTEGRTL